MTQKINFGLALLLGFSASISIELIRNKKWKTQIWKVLIYYFTVGICLIGFSLFISGTTGINIGYGPIFESRIGLLPSLLKYLSQLSSNTLNILNIVPIIFGIPSILIGILRWHSKKGKISLLESTLFFSLIASFTSIAIFTVQNEPNYLSSIFRDVTLLNDGSRVIDTSIILMNILLGRCLTVKN